MLITFTLLTCCMIIDFEALAWEFERLEGDFGIERV
jgi:hypothetical protein